MATVPPTPQKKKNERTLPPKRGKIKAKIFETLVNKVVGTTSKADGRGAAEKNGGEGSDSATTTPPPSAYNSDANSEIN
ncbi:hypothetical protein Ddye_025012 [Dipteronia dyeriana]|uniref:Uncharacterized protein n=1 Tax=Dipteronia dyeriana TaxID=168575 RepID=A0AAD9TWY2_9ROSI|nr:hypothetical protein Ddye_025012 [Dipteronia dyeriana]